jgi:hypothetical protein
MPIFLVLHIVSMFAAVTLLVGEALLIGRVIWQRDVAGLAEVLRLLRGRTITFAGGSLFLIGVAFGLLTALTGTFNLLDGWLIAAYVLVVVLLLLNGTPWVQRVAVVGAQAIEVAAGQRPREDVVKAIERVRTGYVVVVTANVVLFISLIADMVLKPF